MLFCEFAFPYNYRPTSIFLDNDEKLHLIFLLSFFIKY